MLWNSAVVMVAQLWNTLRTTELHTSTESRAFHSSAGAWHLVMNWPSPSPPTRSRPGLRVEIKFYIPTLPNIHVTLSMVLSLFGS